MLQAATLEFLGQLALHNNKSWFDANRPAFLIAKSDIENLAGACIKAIATFDASIAHLQPKDTVYRIYRDVRFSANKTPYKTNFGFYISSGGKQDFTKPGYYVQIEPGKSFMAGGLWMPESAILKNIRSEIDYEFPRLQSILNAASFKKYFNGFERSADHVLSRPPKGYEATNPAIELLKLKSFIVIRSLPDELLTNPLLIKELAATGKAMAPLLHFLSQAAQHPPN